MITDAYSMIPDVSRMIPDISGTHPGYNQNTIMFKFRSEKEVFKEWARRPYETCEPITMLSKNVVVQ